MEEFEQAVKEDLEGQKSRGEQAVAGIYYHPQKPEGLCVSLASRPEPYFAPAEQFDCQKLADILKNEGYLVGVMDVKETLSWLKLDKDGVFDTSIGAYPA